jgi:YD repeat-containing protein
LGLGHITDYQYDANDNLTKVTQFQTGQVRLFEYDSLNRLKSSCQPEIDPQNNPGQAGCPISGFQGSSSGKAFTYLYYDNGSLKQRTDAVGKQVTYSYDGFDRVTLKAHAGPNAAPNVTYCYDGKVFAGADGQCAVSTTIVNSHGRLTQTRNSVSATTYTGFDAQGRITGSTQTTSGQSPYLFTYGYNVSSLTSIGYPSGRVISTTYNLLGQPAAVIGTSTYATATYQASGAIDQLTLQNGMVEKWIRNARLAPISMTVTRNSVNQYSLGYTYGAQDNGNPAGQTITVGSAAALSQKLYLRWREPADNGARRRGRELEPDV